MTQNTVRLQSVVQLLVGVDRVTGHSRRLAARRQLTLERLEDRQLLSSATVISNVQAFGLSWANFHSHESAHGDPHPSALAYRRHQPIAKDHRHQAPTTLHWHQAPNANVGQSAPSTVSQT